MQGDSMQKKKRVIVEISGGGGNQLFIYAYARRLVSLGYDVKIDTWTFYAIEQLTLTVDKRQDMLDNFNITIPRIHIGFAHKVLPRFFERIKRMHVSPKNSFAKNTAIKILKRIREFLRKTNLFGISPTFGYTCVFQNFAFCFNESLLTPLDKSYMAGYYFNTKYSLPIKTILQKELTLKDESAVDAACKKMGVGDNSVSIHIRRGDYLHTSYCMDYILQKEYYEGAMKIIEGKVEHPVYYVFTQDVEWARQNLPKGRQYKYVSELCDLQDHEELVLMSRCHHNIISNSTYSYFAAFLNNSGDGRIVIAPRLWPTGQDASILVLDNWIVIDNVTGC